MALSGSWLVPGGHDGRTLEFSWTATQDTTNNTSTISWRLAGGKYKDIPTANYENTRNIKLVIDGQTVYTQKAGTVIRLTGNTIVASGTKALAHNSAGVRNWSVSVSAGVYTSAINTSGSHAFQLNDIPRNAKIISAPNFNDEEHPVVTYSNPAGANAEVYLGVYYNFTEGFARYRKVSSATNGKYTFNFTSDELNNLYARCQTSNTITVYFYIKTVIGGTPLEELCVERTCTIINGTPTLDPTVTDTNKAAIALTGDNKILIAGVSKANCHFGATAKKGTKLKNWYVKNGSTDGINHDGKDILLEPVENKPFSFSVRDKRENGATKEVTPKVIEYFAPSIAIGDGVPDAQGNFTLSLTGKCFKGSFGAAENTLAVQYRMKENSGEWSEWSNIIIPPECWNADGSFTAVKEFSKENKNKLNYESAYKFQGQITDEINTIQTIEKEVVLKPVFDWGKNDFAFNVPVTIQGNAIEKGEWTPTVVGLDSYTLRTGSYMRMGDVVNLAFTVSGTFKSSVSKETPLTIEGVPFSPIVDAFGGGVCYNAWMEANGYFEGWGFKAGETTITGRTSTVKEASASMLLKTAPNNNPGAFIVVSGSITYKIANTK